MPHDPTSLLGTLERLEKSRADQGEMSKRRFQRFAVRGEALLQHMQHSMSDQVPILISLRDIASGGLGFVCHTPLPEMSSWRVNFLNHGWTIAQHCIMVRYSESVDEHAYLVGGPFCADTGIFCVLGIDPRAIRVKDGPTITPEPT